MNESSSHDTTVELGQLLHRVNAGEQQAFDELTRKAEDRLRILARKMLSKYPHVRRWEQTDDVLQAALIRLHRSLSEVKPDTVRGFFGLSTTQMRRTLIDLARHYYGVYGIGAKHQTDGHENEGRIITNQVGQVEPPERLEEWTAFHEAIESLPDQIKETFSLTWYGGCKQREVAEMLGVSERTVIRRVNRARLMLHDMLSGKLDA